MPKAPDDVSGNGELAEGKSPTCSSHIFTLISQTGKREKRDKDWELVYHPPNRVA